MLSSLLLTPTDQPSVLPIIGVEDQSQTIVEFVRALAIRQARLDASQAFKADNDNERGTIH
jgi:hypothetical protein